MAAGGTLHEYELGQYVEIGRVGRQVFNWSSITADNYSDRSDRHRMPECPVLFNYPACEEVAEKGNYCESSRDDTNNCV